MLEKILGILEFHQNMLGILEFLSKYFAPKSQNIKTQSRFLHALNQLLPSLHKAHLDLFLRSS